MQGNHGQGHQDLVFHQGMQVQQGFEYQDVLFTFLVFTLGGRLVVNKAKCAIEVQIDGHWFKATLTTKRKFCLDLKVEPRDRFTRRIGTLFALGNPVDLREVWHAFQFGDEPRIGSGRVRP